MRRRALNESEGKKVLLERRCFCFGLATSSHWKWKISMAHHPKVTVKRMFFWPFLLGPWLSRIGPSPPNCDYQHVLRYYLLHRTLNVQKNKKSCIARHHLRHALPFPKIRPHPGATTKRTYWVSVPGTNGSFTPNISNMFRKQSAARSTSIMHIAASNMRHGNEHRFVVPVHAEIQQGSFCQVV